MMIILIEGNDNTGKSTLINQLKEKYGYSSFAFPSSDIRNMCEHFYKEMDKTLEDLLEYHLYFIKDFVDKQRHLKKEGIVLLDRYFYSNAAYFITDLVDYVVEKGIPFNKGYKFIIKIKYILFSFYKLLIQPDLVIYLDDHSLNNKLNFITMAYQIAFDTLKPKRLEIVNALQSDTFSEVEKIIKLIDLIPSSTIIT